ncbi:hypothetical protein D1AOALGA4SA_4086 [Olavius algarvensis Delta 1 endosymbiont]|nr:hypothetical protein D1AOALGA4SA_4086 [Olavius algarvensis Delta 1 endosymbiont]
MSQKSWSFGTGKRQSAIPFVQAIYGFRCQVSGVSKKRILSPEP